MRISLNFIVLLMTAAVSLLPVTENKRDPVNMNCENTPARQTEAYVGGNVTINCTYQKTEENNIKTFCRKKENFNCTDVISTHNAVYTQLDRISLTNNKEQQIYTVRISMLTQEDAGTYQCVTKSIYNDSSTCLTEIRLDILTEKDSKSKTKGPPALQATATQTPTPPTARDDPLKLGVIVGVVCLGLLAMALVLLILYRHNLRCKQVGSPEQRTNTGHSTEENHGDDHYDVIRVQNNQASSGEPLRSIYAVVSPHTDQLHYASVIFQKNSDSVFLG
ncbi:CMRF35-like molecule 8 [Mastacembelus armatus]|uniref:CMRF35-like molecule 8 n=1 Tax=Mastacembelus armatus TaxID=205130 RepID=UPI000E461221|nr:CMRF35-like molecule 8 [Mastacembelus armatus]XP_026158272.1 CMRF35-like molecule 8 [Mastacembelus armatus]